MLSCLTSLDPLSSGVLILGLRLLCFLGLPICFLELRVILCGLFLISTPSLLSDVCFYTLSCLVCLSAFLICFFILWKKVHRSSVIGHALIHPIFIHRILLFLGLADFPADEPIHVIGPLGATFPRQRAAHLRVDPSGPRGASSGDVPPPPSSTDVDAERFSTDYFRWFRHLTYAGSCLNRSGGSRTDFGGHSDRKSVV